MADSIATLPGFNDPYQPASPSGGSSALPGFKDPFASPPPPGAPPAQPPDTSTHFTDYLKAPLAGAVEGIGSGIAGIGSLSKLVSPAHYARQLAQAQGASPLEQKIAGGLSTVSDLPGDALQWAGGKINSLGQWIEGTESQGAQNVQAQPLVQGQLLHPSTWKLGPGATLSGAALKTLNLAGNLAPMVAAPEAAGARVLGAAGKAAGELGEAANAIRAGKAIGELSPEVAQAATKLTRSVGRAKQITGAGVGGVQMAEGQAQGEQARIAQMPQDQLEQVPAYQQALASGMTPDQASAHVAQNAHDAAFAATLPLAVAQGGISTLPLLNDTQGVLSRAVGKSRLARSIAGAALEAPVQGGAFVGQNAADIAAVNAATGEKRSPLEDSLATFGSGAAMGGFFGGIGGLHRAEPFPGAAPGTLSDAANTLHRTAGPAPEQPAAAAPATETGTAAEPAAPAPMVLDGASLIPQAPWTDPATGEVHKPTAPAIVAAIHGLLDEKAAQAQEGKDVRFAPRDIAEAWGLPLEQVKSLSKVAANERGAGMTTEQAQARAAAPAAPAGDETAIANPETAIATPANPDVVGNDTGAVPNTEAASGSEIPNNSAAPAPPDLLTHPKAEVSDRQRARIAQRVRGGGVAPGLLDAAAEEATAGARAEPTPTQPPEPAPPSLNAQLEPQSETPPQGGVSASTPPNEETDHGQAESPVAPLPGRGAAAGAGEPATQGEGAAAAEAAGHGGRETGAAGAGRHAVPADTAGLENALSKTDRATGPDGATYLVKQNSNGEGYHFNRLEDGSSTQHRNDNPAQPWTREQAISAAAQMARERAGASAEPAAAAGDAATAAAKPSAPESAQAGQAATEGQVAQASEAPKASNATETTPKSGETQAEPAPAQQTDAKQAPFRVEPLGTAGLLVHGDKDAVRAKLAEAGFKKRGTPQKGALRFDARDRDAIEIALGTRAQGIPGTARDFWREQVSRGEKPQPVFAVLDAAGNWHGWSTSEAGAGREMAKLGNRGELLIRKQTAPKDIAPKPENSHTSRTPGVEPVRRVGAPAAGADHGAGEAGHAGAAKPEMVKGGSFSKPEPSERDLIAQHNTTAEKLAHADRMGGMAVPSIGITRAGHPLQDFGNISLIGDKELVNPATGAKVFGADAYTPRYPEVKFKADQNVAVRVGKIIGKRAGERLEVEHAGTADDLTRQQAFKRYAEEQLGKYYTYHQSRALAEKVLREAGAQERIFKGFTNSGNRRYLPHTLETVVKELKRNLRGGEGYDYGPGSIRAKYTPQFRSIEAIRKAKDKIVAKEDFEKLKEEVNSDFFAVSNELAPYHAIGNDFRFTDTVTQTMQDAARMGIPRALRENGFHDVPQEAQAKLGEFLTHLRNMPTHYFEAILPRGVGIHEFKAAVIPKDTNAVTRALLQRHGLTLHEYDQNVKDDQARAVREAAQARDLLFSRPELREARSLSDARKAAAQNIVGKTLENEHGVVPATLSRTTLDKMLSEKAVQKSVSGVEHARAVANLDHLYRIGVLDHSHHDSRGEPTIAAIHRVVAPMRAENGDTLAVLMTVKETTHPKNPNPLYSVEAVRIEKPALLAPETGGERGTDSNRPPLQAGFDPNVTRMLQDFNDKSPKAARGLPRERVQQIVSAQTAKWGENQPKVRVLVDAEGLPASAKRDPGYKTAEGYYDPATRTAYVVASNLRSEARVGEVLAHEAIGHHGVENVVDDAFGTGAWQKIEDSVTRLETSGTASDKVKDVLAETRRRYPDADARTFAKEFLAVSAEKGVRTGLVDRVVAAIRQYLRKIMPALKISEAELRQTLARAQDYVRSSERYSDRVARMQAMAFSRQPDTFYSALSESMAKAKGAPRKADAAVWKQWLDGAQRRGEFKGSEREWLGLDQWLDAHKGAITREDVNQFVRDNQVRVQEVMHGDVNASRATDIVENEDGGYDLTDEDGAQGDTKFSEYTLPGGTNYRELLLTLPEDHPPKRESFTLQNPETHGTVGAFDSADEARAFQATRPDLKSHTIKSVGMVSTRLSKPSYSSGHFDTPNILAHVRFNDRTGPDGEKILHVEEVQSDWHQAGRKRGYQQNLSEREKEYAKAASKARALVMRVMDFTGDRKSEDWRKLVREKNDAIGERERLARTLGFDAAITGEINGQGVPDAPFKKEWPMLAMKRVLRYAAEHGYDKVTWTTGEQQAARYDLSKQVKSVKVVPVGADGKYHFVATTNDGHPVSETDPAGVTASDLASHIGKELADRAVNDIANGKKAEYSGLELKLGGEGMRAFYDKMLPNELNKYVKQWGAKVGDATIELPLLKGEGDDSNFVAQRVGGDRGFGVRDVYTDQFVAKDLPSMAAAEAEAAARNKVDTRSQALTVHSVEITPAMREGVMQGQPMFSRPAQATMDDLDKVMAAPDPDRSVYEKAKAWLGGKGEDLRPAALGVLQTRHVLELMEHVEPLKGYGKAYGRSMQQLDTDRSHLLIGEPELPDHPRDPKNMLAKGAVPIAQALRDFTYKKGPAGWLGRRTAEGKALFDMMHQATINGMDPDKEYERLTIENAHGDAIPWTKEAVSQRLKLLRELALQRGGDPAMLEKITEEKKYLRNIAKMERTREQRWPELVRQWQALPEAAKDLYRQTRDWYAQHRDAVEQALVKNIEGYDVPETYRRSLINRMRLQFEEARRRGVYFPLNRDGDYWIAFQDAKGNEGFKMFESKSAAQAAEQKLKRSGYQINASGRRDPNARAKSAPPGTFVREVIDILKKAGVSEKTQDAIYQSFLQTLPELSMRKHSIHRRNIAGFSEDGLRAFAKNSFHGAHQLAKLRHLQDMQTTLEAMQQTVDAWRKGGDEMNEGQGRSIGDTAKADALVGELGKRHQWILNPTDAQLANHANALGFVWYLGASPASALTNMTQVVQTVLPVLGAQHGWPKATRMLGAAWRDAARTVGHMDRTLTDPDERRAFLVMQQRGDFSKTQAHTLAGLAEGNVLQSSPAWTKTMNALSWMFHTAEVINREATGMAAFRLARARGDDFNKAIEYAGEINAGTNFDYSAANRPRLMQGNAMRIALQFKQYGVGMSWLFYRNLYQAMKGETPEVRRVARRTVTGILGMTALLAGTTGLPIYNGVKAAANAANLAFGDPDQPFDFDTEFHAWLAEHLGQEAANVIATGPVSELTGADFANRTSMSNLFFQNNDQNLEGADAYHALLESLAGPMGGITKNFYVGAQRIREGNVQRGIETMLPTAVKNSVKALRFAHDGANTLRGDPILPDISGPQDFIQALGFQPTRLAQQEQVNSALTNFTKAVQERRQTLLNAYAMALHAGDPGDRTAVMEKIRAFNQQYPTIAVTPKTLRASLRSRARYSSQAVNGVAISPKLAMQAREFAGTQSQ